MPGVSTADYSDIVSGTLRRCYGGTRHVTKLLARRMGVSQRTIENWFAGDSAPRGAELINLMRECADLEAEILRLVRTARDAGGGAAP